MAAERMEQQDVRVRLLRQAYSSPAAVGRCPPSRISRSPDVRNSSLPSPSTMPDLGCLLCWGVVLSPVALLCMSVDCVLDGLCGLCACAKEHKSRPKTLPVRRIDIGRRPLEPQSDNSRLLALPREVRDFIYQHVLGGGRRIRIYTPTREHPYRSYGVGVIRGANRGFAEWDRWRDPLRLDLLLACRQIYLEAHAIHISHNMFSVDGADLKPFIYTSLGRHNLPHLRSLCLQFDEVPVDKAFFDHPKKYSLELLQKMPQLHELEFQFNHDSILERDKVFFVPYDPRELQTKSRWGELISGLPALKEFRIVFTRGEDVVDPNKWDLRWMTLQDKIQAQIEERAHESQES
ncbi:hypothetical protein HMN09_01126300 [Mycena chlorophos]|uniref:DUF7730 domain-containing protein n=1 Tax=Mycena chlorophos TaxID=658473 RepID=A0A8H6VXT3_MYCCL|nr:hypothetical protein HMN09_01126300 [Mycena chlorophos]